MSLPAVRSPALDALANELGETSLITDPDLLEGYRRDRADLVPAGQPVAAVLARSVGEVQATMAWATRWRIPVVPRGAGTGLSGGATAVDGCVVLSLEFLDHIREVRIDDQMIEVEAGVINAEITKAVADAGLFYPPDPSSFEISTIGGNLATNAGGLCCVKYGVTRDSVLGLEVVLADGRLMHTGGQTVKSVAGYDLTRLFVGSEGTLGIITAATLRLRPRPPGGPVTFVATFPTLEAAGEAVSIMLRQGSVPSLLELMDQPMINAVEDYRRHDLDRSAAALLLGQADGTDAARQVASMTASCHQAGAGLVVSSEDPDDAAGLLSARRLAYFATEQLGTTIIEDVGVPRSRLAELLRAIQQVAKDQGILIATVGHAGDGNLHPTLVVPRDDPQGMERAFVAAELICVAAISLGGTVTGEHGVGVLKRPWLALELDDASRWTHTAIKHAMDPLNILNPGKGF